MYAVWKARQICESSPLGKFSCNNQCPKEFFRPYTSTSERMSRIFFIYTCIWSLFPAVIFEIVQQASFLILFLWFWVNRLRRHRRAWWSMMHCKNRRKLNKVAKKCTHNCKYLPCCFLQCLGQHISTLSRTIAHKKGTINKNRWTMDTCILWNICNMMSDGMN